MREKILVVDDEQLIRWTLTEALKGWQYAPLEAASVAAALEAFEAERPATVLLDINLPDGSGLDLLRDMKLVNSFVVAAAAYPVLDRTGQLLPSRIASPME